MMENKYFTGRICKSGKNLFVNIPNDEKDVFSHKSKVKVVLLEQKGENND